MSWTSKVLKILGVVTSGLGFALLYSLFAGGRMEYKAWLAGASFLILISGLLLVLVEVE